ncbi:TlpA disulfide reductase family protein [Chitinophaga arvensicola]|uniref:Thiol-disulfide isomerase or thioredoxin n=1 Tax=Chitinophaga arvensicola TaxID=29529 RepID=A0A1I0RTQ1_9BACT|nr:TlpA disulfide reductase family protein [Chitinophaga arvensicola]SEW44642.1 Thiol-disulfide isomerase or thioredoxin [Chitinophaga arvensicola]
MNKSIFLIGALIPCVTLAQDISYHVKGNIKNWKGRDTVVLNYTVNNALKSDTALASNGKFEFKGQLAEPVMTYIHLQKPMKPDERRDFGQFYLEDGVIQLNAVDSLKQMKVTSRIVNKDYQQIEALTAADFQHIGALRARAMAMTAAERKSPEFTVLDSSYKASIDSVQSIRLRFAKQHPSNYMALVTLDHFAGMTMQYEKTAPVFASFSPAVKNTPLGKSFAARLEKAKQTVTGAVMPSFTSYDTSRNPIQLNDVVHHAKVTLVDFWASWCGPCRAENPNVVKAFNAFREKGFDIISVSLDDNADRWKAAIIKDGMPWHHVSGLQKWEEPVAKYFGIEAIPDNFLLDEQGRVVARGVKGEALYQKIAAMLK